MSALTLGPLIAKGRTAEVYAWSDDQILKLYYAWCPPDWINRETNIGRVITTKSLPTPKLIDTVQIDGRQGIIYERVNGLSMLQVASTKPWLLFKYARQFAELHSQIHGENGNGLASLQSSLCATIQHVNALPSELKTRVLQLLDTLPNDKALCHFDLHPGQVMITPKGPVIIDWMTAYQGNPIADVARTSLIFMVAQVPGASWVMRIVTNLWRGLFNRTYLAHYLTLHPDVSRDEIIKWMIPVAAGRLKEEIPGEKEHLLSFIKSYLH